MLLLAGIQGCAVAGGLPAALSAEAPPSPDRGREETGRDRARRRQRAKVIAALEGRDVEDVYRELGRAGR